MAEEKPSRLNLKETAKEKAKREEKAFRKAARAERKAARRGGNSRDAHSPTGSNYYNPATHPYSASSHKTPLFPSPTRKPTHDEEFEAHLRHLAELDEGPSSVFDSWETGNYGTGLGYGDQEFKGQIPKRWRDREDNIWIDPDGKEVLDEDSYVESIRQGMWEKKNASEVERRAAIAAEAKRTADRLLDAKRKADQLEKERIKKLEAMKGEKVEQKLTEDRDRFEQKWIALNSSLSLSSAPQPLFFHTLPWPIHLPNPNSLFSTSQFTSSAIRKFLLPSSLQKEQYRGVIREAIKRYHPDRFEGRFLGRVKSEKEQEKVREGVMTVSKVLNEIYATVD